MEEIDVVALARELVAYPSVTGEEGRVAEMIAARWEQAGWHVRRQPVPPENPGGEGRFNILAVDDPKEPPELVLTTHLDTVPPFVPLAEDDEYLYGRGTCDAKGILAAQWVAIERLRARGHRRIGILGVAGEETTSVGAKLVHEVLPRARWIIDGEPTDLDLTSGAKGILVLRVSAEGIAGHSAYPERGRSATHALIGVLARLLDAKLPGVEEFGETTTNVGVIAGGVAPNVIAPEANATVVIRLAAPLDVVLDKVRRIAGDDVKVEVMSGSEPLSLYIPPGHKGKVVRFGSDAPYLSAIGTTILVGPGSILDAHTAVEKVKKQDLVRAVELYVSLGELLLTQPSLPGADGASRAAG